RLHKSKGFVTDAVHFGEDPVHAARQSLGVGGHCAGFLASRYRLALADTNLNCLTATPHPCRQCVLGFVKEFGLLLEQSLHVDWQGLGYRTGIEFGPWSRLVDI